MIWGGLVRNAGNMRRRAMPQAASDTNTHAQPEDTRGAGFLEKLAGSSRQCNRLVADSAAKTWRTEESEAPQRFGLRRAIAALCGSRVPSSARRSREFRAPAGGKWERLSAQGGCFPPER